MKQAQREHEQAVQQKQAADFVKYGIADATIKFIESRQPDINLMVAQGLLVPTETEYPTY